MTYKFPPETKFTISADAMGNLFDHALVLRVFLASHLRDGTRPRVDDMFSMMTRAASSVDILKTSIKEQIPEAEIVDG